MLDESSEGSHENAKVNRVPKELEMWERKKV
jgi:hypothetical protein